MFKIFRFAYNMGRKQAYSEAISRLKILTVELPPTREGQLLKTPINETIAKFETAIKEGGEV